MPPAAALSFLSFLLLAAAADKTVANFCNNLDLSLELNSLLEERKRAVITAAVTGELDVTTARPIGVGKWVPNVGAGIDNTAPDQVPEQAPSVGGIG